eukprot:COSAG03_NODE_497_length_7415_cov_2.348004_8_plen_55_part_00
MTSGLARPKWLLFSPVNGDSPVKAPPDGSIKAAVTQSHQQLSGLTAGLLLHEWI